MINFKPVRGLWAALLLASPLTRAEYRDPSGYEPPPIFESEGWVGNPGGYRRPSPAESRLESSPPPARGETAPVPAAAGFPPVKAPAAPAAGPIPANAGRAAEAPPATQPAVGDSQPPGVLSGLLVDNAPAELILLALIGWVFRRPRNPGAGARGVRKHPAGSQGVPPRPATDSWESPHGPASWETGVARYLRNRW